MQGLYQYCDDCPLSFRFKNENEMKYCGLYWRPKAAKKQGFPANGWNCPRDTWDGMTDDQKRIAKLAERG